MFRQGYTRAVRGWAKEVEMKARVTFEVEVRTGLITDEEVLVRLKRDYEQMATTYMPIRGSVKVELTEPSKEVKI